MRIEEENENNCNKSEHIESLPAVDWMYIPEGRILENNIRNDNIS